ncbi:MAG: bifunctional UDP-N-acetylglucosamine diphosphorylase/glucosamine-1-phosphate N-acetyltransferase GlmU [Synergistaceae bacterium]
MFSDTPKVLQPILDKPLIYYILQAIKKSEIGNTAVMLGFSGEKVEEWLKNERADVDILWQKEQRGTGHAVRLAQEWWSDFENILVLPGDTPHITHETLKNLIEQHVESKCDCSFLSFETSDPTGYGRVIRNQSNIKIVEEKEASEEERMCKEVNSGMYIFKTKTLAQIINELTCINKQNEYYLTEVLTLIQKQSGRIKAIKSPYSSEFFGVNNPLQLAESTSLMRENILKKWMLSGVRFMDPSTTWVGPEVKFKKDILIEPNVQLYGNSTIGTGSRIGSFSILKNAKIEENVTIVGSTRINDSIVKSNSIIGPFVFIRENSELLEEVLVGRFVEIKKSSISKKTKIPHLSYIGDSKIGENTNIGAGTITCNYDGQKKHSTIIGDDCFIGSNTIIVAPINIGNKATTAAGSTITKNVPESSLAISREKQKIIENWYSRKREKDGGK